MRELKEEVANLSGDQWAARGTIVVAAFVFAVLAVLAGDTGVVALVFLPLLAALAGLNPHTQMPTALMLYLMAVWAFGVDPGWHPLTVPAACCLLVIHTAAALAAAFPLGAVLPNPLVRRVLLRVLIVCGLTLVAGVLTGLQYWLQVPGGVHVAIVAMAILGVALALHYRLVTRDHLKVGTTGMGRDRPTDSKSIEA